MRMITAVTQADVIAVAADALKAKLYHRDGILKHVLENHLLGKYKASTITLAIDDAGEFAGVCLLVKKREIQVYVKLEYRRRGVGQELVKRTIAAKNLQASAVTAGPGASFLKSVEFWRKCGVSLQVDASCIPYSRADMSAMLFEKRKVLLTKRPDEIGTYFAEGLFLSGLYDDSREHGIKEQLSEYWKEKHFPFLQTFFHVGWLNGGLKFLSLATIRPYSDGQSVEEKPSLLVYLFVRKGQRSKGLGSEIIAAIKKEYPEHLLYSPSNKNTEDFFDTHGILPI